MLYKVFSELFIPESLYSFYANGVQNEMESLTEGEFVIDTFKSE